MSWSGRERQCTKRAGFRDVSRVLQAEPDWVALPGQTPESVRRLLRRCLQKDRAERLHDIADARLELKEAPTSVPLPAGRSRALSWMAAAVFAAGMLALAQIHFREMPREQQAVILPLLPPQKTSFDEIAVSPDGRRHDLHPVSMRCAPPQAHPPNRIYCFAQCAAWHSPDRPHMSAGEEFR